jgi:hypothetical protein
MPPCKADTSIELNLDHILTSAEGKKDWVELREAMQIVANHEKSEAEKGGNESEESSNDARGESRCEGNSC